MHRVIVILSDGKYHFEKEYQLAVILQPDWDVIERKPAFWKAEVASVDQDLAEGFFQVYCEINIEGLCRIRRGGDNAWTICEGVEVFDADSRVKRKMKEIEERHARAQARCDR